MSSTGRIGLFIIIGILVMSGIYVVAAALSNPPRNVGRAVDRGVSFEIIAYGTIELVPGMSISASPAMRGSIQVRNTGEIALQQRHWSLRIDGVNDGSVTIGTVVPGGTIDGTIIVPSNRIGDDTEIEFVYADTPTSDVRALVFRW